MPAPILSAYDWEMSQGFVRHLRAGFLDNVNNGKLQYRYVYTDKTVEWRDLVTALTSVRFNFTSWWDTSQSQSRLLFVNGLSQIWEWSGGITTLDSTTASATAVGSVAEGSPYPNDFSVPDFALLDTFGGKNYTQGDTITLTGGGANATLKIEQTVNGAIQTVNSIPTAPGTGYVVGDILILGDTTGSISNINTFPNYGGTGYIKGDILNVSGGVSGSLKIESVDSSGAVTSLSIVTGGSGYSVASSVATTSATVGTGCTIQIIAVQLSNPGNQGQVVVDTIDGGGGVLTVHLRTQGAGYIIGSGIGTSHGIGTGCTIEITAVGNGAIRQVSLVNGGSGYSVATSIPVIGGGGTGALMQILTISSTAITKQGTTTWAQDGFYASGTHSVTINGVDYQATGGWGTTTLTGVTPDPTGAGIAGDIIHQTPEITLNSAIDGLPATFENDLIQTFDQQLYLSSLIDNSIFVSRIDNYKDFTHSDVRVTGEGLILVSNAPCRAFVIQEDLMYVSAGLNQWYEVVQTTVQIPYTFTTTVINLNVTTPTLKRLKTTGLQGAISQAFVGKNKNDVIFVSNEPIVNSLGRVDNVVLTPQIADLSFSIVNDMNKYNFTDGCIFFWQNFIFVAVPKEGLIRMYNMTKDTTTQNPTNSPIHYWEAPLTMPFSRFSVIDGELYGHSYLVSETYKMFEGYNFNGHPIPAAAVFAYNQYGLRPQNKSENEFYIEGYISTNATLDMTINYDLDGTSGQYNGTIEGTDTQIIQIPGTTASLGKESLGKNPLGGDLVIDETNTNKFRVIKTFPRTPYYEASPMFSSSGIDYIWSLIAFGPVQTPTSEGNNPITQ